MYLYSSNVYSNYSYIVGKQFTKYRYVCSVWQVAFAIHMNYKPLSTIMNSVNFNSNVHKQHQFTL